MIKLSPINLLIAKKNSLIRQKNHSISSLRKYAFNGNKIILLCI